MHKTLKAIRDSLEKVVIGVQSSMPNDVPLSIAHGSWALPGISRTDLTDQAFSLISLIDMNDVNDVGDDDDLLQNYIKRLDFLAETTAPQLWGNAAQAVPAYLLTLESLRRVLAPILTPNLQAEIADRQRQVLSRLRNAEARLNGVEPRTASLSEMVERIEGAYNAADQLPTDLESLSEAREKISSILTNSIQDNGEIIRLKKISSEIEIEMVKREEHASIILDKCEKTYSAATSVGLASAFSERSKNLSQSMWFWVGGLVLALSAGSFFGSLQLHKLSELINIPTASTSVIVLNLLLSALSVGAPVWFAWLATKQIGQRFRLAEDYAFKASVARAYEGFRREAARFDKEMEAKLLTSALTRLDELPLRLVESDSHGSPWHELASSPPVKDAFSRVPDFAAQVQALAVGAVAAISPAKGNAKSKTVESADDD